jgi:hypothetical protein
MQVNIKHSGGQHFDTKQALPSDDRSEDQELPQQNNTSEPRTPILSGRLEKMTTSNACLPTCPEQTLHLANRPIFYVSCELLVRGEEGKGKSTTRFVD